MENRHLVIFDGVCNFCNGAVHFIIKRDPREQFVFTPMQSQLAKEVMQEYKIPDVDTGTFVLIKHGRAYLFSTAALEISKDLSGYWYLFNVFRILPGSLRDYFYKLFARHRYKLFGRSDTCMLPDDKLKSRFIGLEQ